MMYVIYPSKWFRNTVYVCIYEIIKQIGLNFNSRYIWVKGTQVFFVLFFL